MPNKARPDKQTAAAYDKTRHSRIRTAPRAVGHALDSLLQRRPGLVAKAAQATENDALIEALRTLLPVELAPRALSARQQRSELLVTAASAAWSGRLRYALTALLPELQRRWPDISRVRLRVGPG